MQMAHLSLDECRILIQLMQQGRDMTVRERPDSDILLSSSNEGDFSMYAMQGEALIKAGDAVMLHMLPGDDAPRVARLQAVWSQVPKDGCERKFAQCCLFYRPSVCFSLNSFTSKPAPRRFC